VEDPAGHVDDVVSLRGVGLEEVHRLECDAGGVDLGPVLGEVGLGGGEDSFEVLDLEDVSGSVDGRA
jgi:hypothetical protein